jgi:hypothetical protein
MAENGRSLLAIYLNDHLAGSAGAIELVRRAARQYGGSDLGSFYTELEMEIEQDRDTLEQIMARNGIEPDRVKLAMAWGTEKAARLKFNGALLRRSPLTPFVELELLAVGIHGKLLLWKALQAQPPDPDTEAQLDTLIERAQRQHDKVAQRRLDAAREALTAAPEP